jgi:diacylglycerol O-acyltransferase / trehalose O-mycolyltransferase
MRKLLTLTTILISVTSVTPASAVVVPFTEQRIDGRTVDIQVTSPAMGGVEHVRLLLPKDWSRRATRTWPVLYLLHGSGDDYTVWTKNTDVEQATADAEAIVAMPDGGKCGNYSNWWNQGKFGPPAWETFHLTELRQILEHDYRAGPQRAIAGLSMGGFGAMSYAARHPDMFKAVASYSGTVNPLDFPMPIMAMGLFCPGLDWKDLWGDPAVPGQLEIWQLHNPPNQAENLRGKALFMSSGNGKSGPLDGCCSIFDDWVEHLVQAESQSLLDRLNSLRIPVTTDFYGPGHHSWPYWQRELHRSLPLLLSAIGA